MDTTQHLNEIEGIALNISARTREIADLREQLGIIEAREVLSILGMKDEGNKSVYSNEAARGAALTINLSEQREHQSLTARLREAEEARAHDSAAHERRRNEFKLFLLDKQIELNRERALNSLSI